MNIRLKKFFLIASLVLITPLISAQQEDEEAVKIIQEAIKVRGGKEVFDTLETLDITGSLQIPEKLGQEKFPLKVKNKKGGKVYVEMKVMGKPLKMAENGEGVQQTTDFSGNVKEKEKDSKSYVFYEFFTVYDQDGYTVSYGGKEKLEEQTCHKLVFTHKDSLLKTYWLDKKTMLPLKISSKAADGKEKIKIFNDYRELDNGFIYPHYVERREGDVVKTIFYFEDITANSVIQDEVFDLNNHE